MDRMDLQTHSSKINCMKRHAYIVQLVPHFLHFQLASPVQSDFSALIPPNITRHGAYKIWRCHHFHQPNIAEMGVRSSFSLVTVTALSFNRIKPWEACHATHTHFNLLTCLHTLSFFLLLPSGTSTQRSNQSHTQTHTHRAKGTKVDLL